MNELTRRKSEKWREKLGMVAKIGVAATYPARSIHMVMGYPGIDDLSS